MGDPSDLESNEHSPECEDRRLARLSGSGEVKNRKRIEYLFEPRNQNGYDRNQNEYELATSNPPMKKVKSKSSDELRPEYNRSDFSTLVRGKCAARLSKGSNIVALEPEVAGAFPNDKAVNDALRALIEVAATTARLNRRSTERTKTRHAG